MKNMELIILFPLSVLGLAAWQDYRTRLIDDWVLALLWVGFAVSGSIGACYVAVWALGLFYLLNSLIVLSKTRVAYFGDADLLMVPPFIGLMSMLGWLAPLWMVGVAGVCYATFLKKRSVPVAPMLFFWLLVGVILAIFFQI